MRIVPILAGVFVFFVLVLAVFLYFSNSNSFQNNKTYTITFNASKMIGTTGTLLIINNKSYTYYDMPVKLSVPNGSIIAYTFQQDVSNSSGFYHLESIKGCNKIQNCVITATYNFTPISNRVFNITLLFKNQTFILPPGWFRIIPIPTPESYVNITGAYTSNIKMDVAILNQTEYQNFMANKTTISSSKYYYEISQNATINKTLQQGTYFLVFYNPNTITNANVTITQSIVVK